MQVGAKNRTLGGRRSEIGTEADAEAVDRPRSATLVEQAVRDRQDQVRRDEHTRTNPVERSRLGGDQYRADGFVAPVKGTPDDGLAGDAE